ncbi:MAG: Uma2 family endonuclease [Candidatus Poribacteria bacterium]|nr:Uma2 family endonuclease [Candidatus Poribacteria bacterium]
MASLAAETYITPDKYLALERKATVKSEYLNGKIRATPRANFAHNLITVDIATELNIQSRGQDWEVYMSNMRVKTNSNGAYFYPDVIACCSEPEFEDNVFDTLLNPILVIEVLSPSTEVYDRGEKFRHYQELASLQEYILVSQDRVRVERYHLAKTQWVQTELRGHEDVLSLNSIRCKLPLQDIYRRVPEIIS